MQGSKEAQLNKIVVKNFEELVVIVIYEGRPIVVHGSTNRSQPGIIATREPVDVVIVDKSVVTGFTWWTDIVSPTGETLQQYRVDAIIASIYQAHEPETKIELKEVLSESVTA